MIRSAITSRASTATHAGGVGRGERVRYPLAALCRDFAGQVDLQCVRALVGFKVASLLVVEDGRLVGVFTERDVLERVALRRQRTKLVKVREVMTSNSVVVHETDPAGAALSAIAVAGFRHVPVLDVRNAVVGVISPRRVFEFLLRRMG